jgi:hypothetical protein
MNTALFLVVAAMTLVVPVTSCLLVLQARQDGHSVVPSICAAATAWTIAIAILPPLRGVISSMEAISPFWVVVPVAVIYLVVMFVLTMVPPWVARACPWREDAAPDIHQWFTFSTMVAVGVLSLVTLVTLLLVFGQWMIELSKAGIVVYLVRLDGPTVLTTDVILTTARSAAEAFWTTPGQVFLDATRIPGLPFSTLVLTLCFSANVAIALADQPLVEDEDQTT